MAKRAAPEVNAGSMADIAFLLLIFFLVTTTIETDSGINRKLPPTDEVVDPPIIKERNIFTVVVNKDNRLLVEEDVMEIGELRQAAITFLDNGGGSGEEACDYCQGKKDPSSSDNPEKAIISLKNDRETSYKVYIAVQNELVAAYNEVRDEYAQSKFGKTMKQLEMESETSERADLQLDAVKAVYPQRISEAEPKNAGE